MKFDIGFLGGGQLARMSIQAAQRMGLQCLSLDPGEDTPASQIAPALVGALDDSSRIAELFESCSHVTLENEFIPAQAIRSAAGDGLHKLVPGVETLAVIQDKLLQRHAFANAGVPSPRAVAIEPGDFELGNHPTLRAPLHGRGMELARGSESLPFPMVLKARFGGYDGKGTRYARTAEEFESHKALWSQGGCLAEEFVPFKRELAAMVYVSEWGAGCFPTMETVQTNHVCDLVYPADVDASNVALGAVEAVGGRGLFGVEMFETEDGDILINEIAPRPHNTGHYTLDWGGVSQFEQHVRLVMGMPLAKPSGSATCMANLLGQEGAGDFRRGVYAALEDPAVRVHWYGKAESRPGRKMGHLNVVGVPDLVDRARAARERFYAAWTR